MAQYHRPSLRRTATDIGFGADPASGQGQLECPKLEDRSDRPTFRSRLSNRASHPGYQGSPQSRNSKLLPPSSPFRPRVISYYKGQPRASCMAPRTVAEQLLNQSESVVMPGILSDLDRPRLATLTPQIDINLADILDFDEPRPSVTPNDRSVSLAEYVSLLWYGDGLPRRHWKNDQETNQCDYHACGRRFHMLSRRHHCRLCGYIFCGSCSAHTVFLLYDLSFSPTHGTPTRACLRMDAALSVFQVSLGQ
ncbi:hypothetical protein BJ085DRAFT_30577 [Dimargaris cristalligena]|uniref:FYVE-type domain-containing protein n=1 Tax=Dimargaris cristalligena TaxID=215637 RepID=A0A4P9ZRN9_9FUNG|nr:hypothetical protein BJ085DRAFT_30577 [Dimargaris cristalligena]|eukprot:RKP36123.1 hypothetical protein BJ085DRAFT_30577 [Dimargaris cristalligena]